MHNPPHPGEDTVLRKNGGLTVTEFAKRLGVSRVVLSRMVKGRAAVSAALAIRLAKRSGALPSRGSVCRRLTASSAASRRLSGCARRRPPDV